MTETEQTSREVADTEMNAVKKGFDVGKDIWSEIAEMSNAYENSAEDTIEEYTSRIGGQPSKDFDALAERFKEVNKSLDELNNEKDVYFASHNRGLTFEEWSHKPEREALYKEREELLNKMENLAFRDAMMQNSLDEEGVLDLEKYLNASAVEINDETVNQWKKQSQVIIKRDTPVEATPVSIGEEGINPADPEIINIDDERTANAREHVLEIMESTKSADKDFSDIADKINVLSEDIKDLEDSIDRGNKISGDFLKKTGIDLSEADRVALNHPVMMSIALAKESCSDLKTAFESTKSARDEYNATLKEFWDVTKSYAKDVSDPIKESIIMNYEKNVSRASNIFTGAVAGLNEAIDLSLEAIKNNIAAAEKAYIKLNDKISGGLETKIETFLYTLKAESIKTAISSAKEDPKKVEMYNKNLNKMYAKIELLNEIKEENWHGPSPVENFYEKIGKTPEKIHNLNEKIADKINNGIDRIEPVIDDIMDKYDDFVKDTKKTPETVKSWITEGAKNIVKDVEKGLGVSMFLAHQAMQAIKKDSLNIAVNVMTGLEKLCDARERVCENLIAKIDDRKEKLKAYKEERIEVATKFADVKERKAEVYSNSALEKSLEASRQAVLENYGDAKARATYTVLNTLYAQNKGIHDIKEGIAIKDEYYSSKVKNLIPSAIAAKDVIHTQKALSKVADRMDKALTRMEAIKEVKNAIASGKGQIMGEINKMAEASKNITKDLENEGEERD